MPEKPSLDLKPLPVDISGHCPVKSNNVRKYLVNPKYNVQNVRIPYELAKYSLND